MPGDTTNLDEVAVAVGYFDVEQCCVFVNTTAGRWMRSSPDAMRGLSVRQILGEHLYRDRLPHIDAVLTGVVEKFQGWARYPDGVTRRVCMTLSPDLKDGRVAGYFVSTVDLDLIGEHAPGKALHRSLVAALSENELAQPSTAEAEVRIDALLGIIKGHLAEVVRKLGTASTS
jgi:hypothetical protein